MKKQLLNFILILFLMSCWGGEKKKVIADNHNERVLHCSEKYNDTGWIGSYINVDKQVALTLPFSLEDHLGDFFEDYESFITKYNSYTPADKLMKYFESIDYEGEEYKCYIIPHENKDIIVLVAWILRGDSEYYLIISADKTEVSNYLLAGHTGDDGIIYFVVNDDLEIEKYRKSEDGEKHVIGKYKIDINGKIN